MFYVHSLLLAAVLVTTGEAVSPATNDQSALIIVSAEFGTLGARRKLDIVQPIQRLCGTDSSDCSVFCSETSFGLYRLGRKPICRVTYRCPDHSTRSIEAARKEPVLMRCGATGDEEEDGSAETAEKLSPPPYVPPAPPKN